ncbi:MAG: hypothetical protein AAFP26_07370, partial [Planctomycetota bacterium]
MDADGRVKQHYSSDDGKRWIGTTNNQPGIGFSVAASRWRKGLVVTGAPHARERGCVFVNSYDYASPGMKIIGVTNRTICSPQKLSSFGYSVALIDLNKDGREELLVGAPAHYDHNKRQFVGAVYVYRQRGMHKVPDFRLGTVLYGAADSAFGSAIVGIGDVNDDGVDDVAIGAPDDDEAAGSVWIFHGDADSDVLINDTASQVIRGRSIDAGAGFGFALSGGMDMDSNGLPDLVVGTRGDTAVRVRARPIVSVQVEELRTSTALVSVKPNGRDPALNYTDPRTGVAYHVTTFDLTACFTYTSRPVAYERPVNVTLSLSLDPRNLERLPRASFAPARRQPRLNSSVLIASKRDRPCIAHQVFLLPDIVDKLSPIGIDVAVESLDTPRPARARRSATLPRVDEIPVENRAVSNRHQIEVSIAKDCGKDNVCESDLRFEARLVEKLADQNRWRPLSPLDGAKSVLVLGPPKQIGVRVNVTNLMEDAHQAHLLVHHSDQVRFQQATTISPTGAVFSCGEAGNGTQVQCDLGNPFPAGATLDFVIVFSLATEERSLIEDRTLNVSVGGSTTSTQSPITRVDHLADIVLLSEITVDGYVPDQYKTIPFGNGDGAVIGQSAVEKAADAGPYVVHRYEIENSGLNDVADMVAEISWPYRLVNGKWLLYFIEAAVVDARTGRSRTLRCVSTPADALNPLGLEYDLYAKTTPRANDGSVDRPLRKRREPYDATLLCPEYGEGCANVTCELGTIPKKSRRVLEVRAVMWNGTLIEEYADFFAPVEIGSALRLRHPRPDEVMWSERSRFGSRAANRALNKSRARPLTEKINFVLVLAAVAAGLFLLVVIVLVCWRCGFFVRSKKRRH